MSKAWLFGVGSLAVVVACSAAPSEAPDSSWASVASCGSAPPCGTEMASIDGIAAYSNGSSQCTWNSCAGWLPTGYGYQCVELAQRYFHQRWGIQTVWPVNFAAQMCKSHPAGTTVHYGGYAPVHGDLIVYPGTSTNSAGHVAVIDWVQGTQIGVVEENSSGDGTRDDDTSRALCFVHADANVAATAQTDDLFLLHPDGWSYATFSDGQGGWTSAPGPQFGPNLEAHVGDFDGNGLGDVFLYDPVNGGGWTELGDGAGGYFEVGEPTFAPGWTVHTGDFDGDGLTDLFLVRADGSTWTELADGSGHWRSAPGPKLAAGAEVHLGTFDAGGTTDVFMYQSGTGESAVYLSIGNGGFKRVGGPWFSPWWSVHVGDFDGNGKSDLFLERNGETWVELANGFGTWSAVPGPWFSPGWSVTVGDYDGDRRDDLFLYEPSSGGSYVELANGGGGWISIEGPAFATGWQIVPGHFDGDRMTDLFLYNPSNGWTVIEFAAGGGSWRDVPGPAFSPGWSAWAVELDRVPH